MHVTIPALGMDGPLKVIAVVAIVATAVAGETDPVEHGAFDFRSHAHSAMTTADVAAIVEEFKLAELSDVDKRHLEQLTMFTARHASMAAAAAAQARGVPSDTAAALGATAALDASLRRRWAAFEASEAWYHGNGATTVRRAEALMYDAVERYRRGEWERAWAQLRAASALAPTHLMPLVHAAEWLDDAGDDTSQSIHLENSNSWLMTNKLRETFVAGTPATLNGCLEVLVLATVLPPLAPVPDPGRNETELEAAIVRGLDSIGANVGILVDELTCAHRGSLLYHFAYVDRPPLQTQLAYQRALYRAFGGSLIYVAEHLKPMYDDPVGTELSVAATTGQRACQCTDCNQPPISSDELTHVAGDFGHCNLPVRERLTMLAAPGRIRLGIVSELLYPRHSVTKAFGAVLGALDPALFTVAVFWVSPSRVVADEGFLEYGCDAEVFHLGDAGLAARRKVITDWAPHVLVFTDMGMSSAVDRTAMARMAPSQVLLPGHSVTSGLSTIDVAILVEDASAAVGHYYSERSVIPLRTVGMKRPQPRGPPAGVARSRADFGFLASDRLYVCPQVPVKVHPQMDAWMVAILRRDPRARIVFVADRWIPQNRGRLQRRIRAAVGAEDESRVVVLPTVGQHYDLNRHYVDLIMVADVILDTYPFGGATSTLETLAVGQVLVTLPGYDSRGRHSVKYMQHIGLFELIAGDPEEYVAIAVRVANDKALRSRLRKRILARVGLLFEAEGTVEEYQRIFAALGTRARALANQTLAGCQ